MKNSADQYDDLFKRQGEALRQDWRLFKAMAKVESNFNPEAVSQCGAIGLMQIMPSTAADLGISLPNLLKEPIVNIRMGTAYFSMQYRRLAEIVTVEDRLKAALASYNGGRGYVKKAIALYRADKRQRFEEEYVPPTWEGIAHYLADPRCLVKGEDPDHRQMTEYVEKVWCAYQRYINEGA